MQHYHSALSTSATPTTPDDLISDGVFLRHFLLLIYDICVPMAAEEGGAGMWAEHLKNLRMIAVQRSERLGREPFPFILWALCELDVRACLLGGGTCDFMQTVIQRNMLPPLELQIPTLGPSMPGPYLPSEANVFPSILNLNQGVTVHAGKLAQLAQRCRAEALSPGRSTSDVYARWQAAVSQVQNELLSFWAQNYPEFLGPQESPQAAFNLPFRVRWMFEHVSSAFDANRTIFTPFNTDTIPLHRHS